MRKTRSFFDLHTARDAEPDSQQAAETIRCPLCDRPIPPGARSSLHHLTPKLKGGAKQGTVRLHQICHSAIHARFSEAEIARRLADVESLRQAPELTEFLTWIRTKPDDFHAGTASTRQKRAARPRSNGRR